MKKTICLFLILILILATVVGCGKKEKLPSEAKFGDEKDQLEETEKQTEKATETENLTESEALVTEPPKTEPIIEPMNIEWITIKQTETDSDGYSYEVTYKFSPWILLSNTDIVNSAWRDVSKDKVLPGIKDWGLDYYNGTYSRGNIKSSVGAYCGYVFFGYTMTDMYYSVGTVSVKNTTPGWNITKESPRNPRFGLRWNNVKEAESGLGGAESLCRVFYSTREDLISEFVSIAPLMESNSWGPVPFVLMVPENYSPKYPDGQFYEYHRMGYFGLDYNGRDYDTKLHLGIIGKDGVYVSPAE